jgi:acyl carrier protein
MAEFYDRIKGLLRRRGLGRLLFSPTAKNPNFESFMSDDLHARIKQVMVEELMLQVQPEDIADDAPIFGPEGLGLDSVDVLQLVIALEKNFGLKISEGDAAKELLKSVSSIAAAIRALEVGAG